MSGKEKKWFRSKFFKNKLTKIILVIAFLAIVPVLLIRIFLYQNEEKITSAYLGTKLSESSELTTAKLSYSGLVTYEDKGVPIINKGDFLMVYEATARVGIDLKEVKAEVDKGSKIVWLTIPKAEVQDVKVDTSSLKYYNEKFTLFNVNEKEDSNKAIKLAEDNALEEVSQMGVLEYADSQAVTLIKGLLQDAVPEGYEFREKGK